MNPLQKRKIALERAIAEGEPLDEFIDIIEFALDNGANDWRVPYEQHGERFLIGTEWWNYAGAAHYRTILLHRKSELWHPDSVVGQVSAFEVYAASQSEPPDNNVFDEDRGTPADYAADAMFSDVVDYENWKEEPRRAQIFGPPYGGTRQEYLAEAPADLSNPIQVSAKDYPDPELQGTIANPIPTVYQKMKRYSRELSTIHTQRAVENRDKLEKWLRKKAKAANRDRQGNPILDGDLVAVTDAYLAAQYFRGMAKTVKGARRKIADTVRKNCSYFVAAMDASENELTREIAAHLREFVKVGVICEYTGNWKWKF